ncbi:MAG: TSUP family transporter [Rectinemataceae bacterium]
MTISAQLISSGIQFLEGVGVGSFGGFISGLLGITAGGVLVPAIVIILGFSQHRAQALSLAALLPPTSIHGVLQYRRRGHEISPREVTLLALAFLAGSFCGASIAGVISDRPLRWMYVGYLVLLTLLLILRHKDGPEAPDREEDIVSSRSETMALLIIGLIAGISSGLLGIGGGLAITVGMAGLMGRPQHQAQALSLAVCLLPTGLPGVWVYVSRDPHFPWILLIGLVLGLLLGTSVGAKAATRLESRQLRYGLLVLISLNVVLMTWEAIKV